MIGTRSTGSAGNFDEVRRAAATGPGRIEVNEKVCRRRYISVIPNFSDIDEVYKLYPPSAPGQGCGVFNVYDGLLLVSVP